MHITNLRKVGGSVMLAVPPALLETMSLRAGAAVSLSLDGGRLIVEAQKQPHYTLDELLAQCQPGSEPDAEERVWLDAAPLGDELP